MRHTRNGTGPPSGHETALRKATWPWGALLRVLGVLATVAIVRFLHRGYQVRTKMRRLQAQGIPTLPHSLLSGHIPLLLRFRSLHPADAHFNTLTTWLATNCTHWLPKCPNGPRPALYLDFWPIFPDPMLLVFDHALASQFTQAHAVPAGRGEWLW
ncbi:hypothetical protein B0T26DRAFT_752926 [Lasiosphaeria miniovina]|uniref:Uncharacterized protein n=1 Tax=Lasiosphaeria miniovina TaxID=1954250 RepID=A0AA40AB85_9PEZI|nr:uncharacterized protein B0T26DRAFT_752926 [Lasiosphaeria miniovina]KAK0712725.1 hypothetical protein B0T26DRAFT_752926 [Lasiosphaeria miniovina]